jgi:hypothetical protein
MIKIEKLREQAFGFFYVLTERSVQTGNESRFGTIFWSLLYVVDAGQVISSMAQPAHGWHPEVLLYLDKLDLFKTIFTSVCAHRRMPESLPRKPERTPDTSFAAPFRWKRVGPGVVRDRYGPDFDHLCQRHAGRPHAAGPFSSLHPSIRSARPVQPAPNLPVSTRRRRRRATYGPSRLSASSPCSW